QSPDGDGGKVCRNFGRRPALHQTELAKHECRRAQTRYFSDGVPASLQKGSAIPHALIVEDDTPSRSALMELVAGEGFSVAGAGSLREARERVTERRPDIALLDLELPDGNGMDLFGDVKSRTTTEV